MYMYIYVWIHSPWQRLKHISADETRQIHKGVTKRRTKDVLPSNHMRPNRREWDEREMTNGQRLQLKYIESTKIKTLEF